MILDSRTFGQLLAMTGFRHFMNYRVRLYYMIFSFAEVADKGPALRRIVRQLVDVNAFLITP